MAEVRRKPGLGLDIGTMFLVSAEQRPDGIVVCRKVRDAFIEVEEEDARMLKLSKISTIQHQSRVLVVGDDALQASNLFKRGDRVTESEEQRLRRPIQGGIISSSELFAQDVLAILIRELIGEPVVPGEKVSFSIPAKPLDVPGQDVVFHRGIFEKILEKMGYTPTVVNEAEAIIYSECTESNFSAIAASFGSGMTNVKLCYRAMPGMEFSLVRGGDWVDKSAANAVNSIPSRCCALKEKGFDLQNPLEGDPKYRREREAIAIYHQALVKYVVVNVAAQFQRRKDEFELPEPIPWVISGGTSLITGFVELFKRGLDEERRRGFPIEISKVCHAKYPLEAVARGLLVSTQL